MANDNFPQLTPLAIGTSRDYTIQVPRPDGTYYDSSNSPFDGTETLAATVAIGVDFPPLLNPAIIWVDATTATFKVSFQDLDTTGLSPGEYILNATAHKSARTANLGTWYLPARRITGTETQATKTYCGYEDMLEYAGWVADVQEHPSDHGGFYKQRLKAREWFDWAALNCYRGAGVGNFESASLLAFAWGGGVGARRGIGPSPSLVQWLADDKLIVRPQVVEACAYKAISLVGLAQIGRANQQAALGAYFRDMADRTMTAITAEVDLNGDGIGEILVSLASTNTLMT